MHGRDGLEPEGTSPGHDDGVANADEQNEHHGVGKQCSQFHKQPPGIIPYDRLVFTLVAEPQRLPPERFPAVPHMPAKKILPVMARLHKPGLFSLCCQSCSSISQSLSVVILLPYRFIPQIIVAQLLDF